MRLLRAFWKHNASVPYVGGGIKQIETPNRLVPLRTWVYRYTVALRIQYLVKLWKQTKNLTDVFKSLIKILEKQILFPRDKRQLEAHKF